MAAINVNLRCDLQQPVKVQYLDGVIFSQDNQGNVINVTVFDGGEPAELSGSVSANIVRSDGGTVAATGGTLTDNVASITLPSAAYLVPGVVSITVKITSSSVITTIAAVVANVYQSTTDTAIDPGTIIPSVQTLIADIESARASIPAGYEVMWTTLAPAFDTGTSYVPGQYCTYNGGLYRFKKTHSGSWASGDVDAITVGGALTENRTETETLTGTTNNILQLNSQTPILWYVAKNVGISNTTGNEMSSSVFSATEYIDIRAFSSITYKRLHTTASSVTTGIAFYDANKTYISGVQSVKSAETRHYEWYTPNLPSNAAYVRCTMFKEPPAEGEVFGIYGTAKIQSTLATMQTDIDKLKAEQGSETDVDGVPVVIPYEVITGYSVYGKTGGLITSSVYNCTDYVDIRGYCRIDCKRVTIASSNNYVAAIAFYDSNKNFLYSINCKWNSESGYEDQSLAFPSEVAYVRCTIRADTETYGEYVITGYKRFFNDADICIEPYFNLEQQGNLNAYDGSNVSSTYYCRSNYVYCAGFDYLRFKNYVTISDSSNYGLCFYDENQEAINVGQGMKQGEANAAFDSLISIPVGAYYVRVSYPMQENIIENSLPDPYLRIYKTNTISQRAGRNDGLTPFVGNLYFRKPKSKGAENAVRRMHQLTQLKFTPIHNFPKEMHNVTGGVTYSEYIAGIEYTGLPYSVTYDRRNNINVERTIDVYMSAVANVKTRMFDTTTQNYPRYSYFGAVCSSFVAGAMGLKYAPLTKDMPDFLWFDKIAPAGAFNEQTLELGDILLKASSHVTAVSGILTDSTGKIVLVEISEECLGGYIATAKAVSRWSTPEQLFTRLGDYDLYRYRYIDEVEYFESDYSHVYPEGFSYNVPQKYIYPVYGDKCVFRTSSTAMEIAISANAYDDGGRTIKVYRDGTLVQTETLDAEMGSITVDRQTVGKYLVTLLNESNVVIDTTTFEIIDGTFTKSISNGVATVTYDTASTLYAIEYKVTGDSDEKFLPVKPVTGTGVVQSPIPANATITGVVIGNRNGTVHAGI